MEITQAFISIVAVDNLNIDSEKISNFCYEIQKRDSGKIESNEGGWQSNELRMSETFPILSAMIDERLNMVYGELGFKNEYRCNIDNAWININKNKDFNYVHEHTRSFLSGVYYAKAPKNCGNLVLKTPVMTLMHYIDPKFIKEFNSFNSCAMEITPETNKLVIFPSWLLHYVKPNLSSSDRISIAFNTYIG